MFLGMPCTYRKMAKSMFKLNLGNTYRAVYTVKLADGVYVLHCFQKKSTSGIATPKPDMDLIHERLKVAQEHAKGKTK